LQVTHPPWPTDQLRKDNSYTTLHRFDQSGRRGGGEEEGARRRPRPYRPTPDISTASGAAHPRSSCSVREEQTQLIVALGTPGHVLADYS
jgi:hypothetical protein